MAKIETMDLLSGRDIYYDNLCVIRPPHLKDIAFEVGYTNYLSYVNVISLDTERCIKNMGVEEKYNQMSEEQQESCTAFNLLILHQSTRELLRKALSFFIPMRVVFDPRTAAFLVYDEEKLVCQITNDNYMNIRYGIMQTLCLSNEAEPPAKFKDSATKKLWEKMMKGRKERKAAQRTDVNMTIENMVGAVSAYSNTYNLTNIWDLTIYQLFDQFYRINGQVQLKAYIQKWAAWGTKDFDFTAWYKDIQLNK